MTDQSKKNFRELILLLVTDTAARNECARDVRDYVIKNGYQLAENELKRLDTFFGGQRLIEITPSEIASEFMAGGNHTDRVYNMLE